MYKKLLIAFCVGFFSTTFTPVKAQNVYAFSVIETNDISRPDRIIDNDRVQKTGMSIAKYLGIDYNNFNFGDENAFSVSAVKETLKRLKKVSCKTDIIWFHYSGYGRNDGQSNWPIMKLTDGELSTAEIIATLQAKRPKLLLITIEAGNKQGEPKQISNQAGDETNQAEVAKLQQVRKTSIVPIVSVPTMKKIPSFSVIANYEQLFKEFEGMRVVILSSCSVGQNSASNLSVGSEWLMEFSEIFEQLAKNDTQPTSWENINRQITTNIQTKLKGKQTPQGSIKTVSINCTNQNEQENE